MTSSENSLFSHSRLGERSGGAHATHWPAEHAGGLRHGKIVEDAIWVRSRGRWLSAKVYCASSAQTCTQRQHRILGVIADVHRVVVQHWRSRRSVGKPAGRPGIRPYGLDLRRWSGRRRPASPESSGGTGARARCRCEQPCRPQLSPEGTSVRAPSTSTTQMRHSAFGGGDVVADGGDGDTRHFSRLQQGDSAGTVTGCPSCSTDHSSSLSLYPSACRW